MLQVVFCQPRAHLGDHHWHAGRDALNGLLPARLVVAGVIGVTVPNRAALAKRVLLLERARVAVRQTPPSCSFRAVRKRDSSLYFLCADQTCMLNLSYVVRFAPYVLSVKAAHNIAVLKYVRRTERKSDAMRQGVFIAQRTGRTGATFDL